QIDAGAGSRSHFAARAGQAGGSHILNADDEAFLHGLEAGLEQQFLHKRVADLNVRPLGAGIFSETSGSHGSAVNTVAPGFRADVDHRIADAGRAAIKDLVFFEDAECKGVHQRVLRVTIGKVDFAADGRDTETVSVERNAADHAFENAFVLSFVQRP